MKYVAEVGWARVDDLLSSARARSILDTCLALLDGSGAAMRPGDKPHGGTRRLTELVDRVPELAQPVADLNPLIGQIIDGPFEMGEATFRCPGPGFGSQKLHADTLPRLAAGPDQCATAIVPLVDFTETNGSTRVVPGSHHRIDLQRKAGNLDRVEGELQLTGPVGVGFIFSGHLLHSGTTNNSSADRPALQLTYRRSE